MKKKINHIKRKGFKLIEHIYLNRIQFVDPNYSRFRGINLTDKPKYSRADYYKNESLCHTFKQFIINDVS